MVPRIPHNPHTTQYIRLSPFSLRVALLFMGVDPPQG
jgi:hypothetical protein